MRWLDQWFVRKFRWAREQPDIHQGSIAAYPSDVNKISLRPSEDLDTLGALRFTMHRATNGYVMDVRSYDRRTDRTNSNLHIITDEENVGDCIAKILTVESMRAS